MKNNAAASRYALAIFELGQQSGELASVRAQLSDLATAYHNSEPLRRALHNPLLGPQVREKILRELAAKTGMSTLATHSVLVLLRRRRLDILPQLVAELLRLSDEQEGICRASVTSANSLSQSLLERIQASLEASTGKRVVLEHREDASLIGGLITQVGDKLYDGSIAGRLRKLEKSLLSSD